VLLRLHQISISELSPRLSRGSVLVSATNGKTTTSAMLCGDPRSRLDPDSWHNRAGSNMHWGVATELLRRRSRRR